MPSRSGSPSSRAAAGLRWWERAWVAATVALVALTGFQVLPDLWPYQSWTMFSSPGPPTSDYLVVVAIDDDGDREVHRDERLPGGYLRDGYLHRFETASDEQRAADCDRMLSDLRAGAPDVVAVELERWEWELLARDGARPARIDREVVWWCEP